MTDHALDAALAELLDRSRRLGADRSLTNYAGGNTSAKVAATDPVTGERRDVLLVKGSGGDLGTLTARGVAQVDLARARALEARFRAGVPEAAIVDLYAHCRFGGGGATPSIDTPLHALLDAAHVDHLHPDAVIALAVAADGPALVARCYGDEVGWLDWLRPGYELGLRLRDLAAARPGLVGVVLGGHGLITWADDSATCEARSRELVARADAFRQEHGRVGPLGPVARSRAPLAAGARRTAVVALAPVVRGLAASERPVVGHFADPPGLLDFLSRERALAVVRLGTSCPDHFLRTRVRPLVLDLPADAPHEARVEGLRDAFAAYREDYRAYYARHADPASPPMRGTDPTVVLVPGLGMWSFAPDPAEARITGEFLQNAVAAMEGAEALSAYAPIPEAEKFGIEYWELEERKLRARPPAPALAGRIALVVGGASGIGRAIACRLLADGACVAVADHDLAAAEGWAAGAGRPERVLAVHADVRDDASVRDAVDAVVARFGGLDIVVNSAGIAAASALLETSLAEWERVHDVVSTGSFVCARESARVLVAQGIGGQIVQVVSKNAVVAGPSNAAYSTAKASQAHLVRVLAAELGAHGIRVNGVNPDAVVRGSGIFQGDWLRDRASAYGVEPEELPSFYASRTLLKQEVTPDDVAAAVRVLVGDDLSRTTGLLVPVDAGLAPAFLR